jgi:hypothetical protein
MVISSLKMEAWPLMNGKEYANKLIALWFLKVWFG